MADYFVCSLTVPVYKSVYCVVHDLLGNPQHSRDMSGIGIQLGSLHAQHQLRNISGLVSDSLDIRDHLQRCRNHPQIPCNRLLSGDQRQASGFDISLHIIDYPVSADDFHFQIFILAVNGS